MWHHVIENFDTLIQNLSPTLKQTQDIITKVDSINSCLVSRYYQPNSNIQACQLAGSHGKGTGIRPLSDVDVHFFLPQETVIRFMKRSGNQPSQLLQDVKNSLTETFPDTEMNADGQVVVLNFSSVMFEVVPVYLGTDNLVYYCDSNDGGTFRACNPIAEINYINHFDRLYQGKARHLIRFVKAWKQENFVDLKSSAIEVVVCSFLSQWQYNQEGMLWYDWMVRDFFEFLISRKNYFYTIHGTNEQLPLGDSWAFKAERSYKTALTACDYERNDWGHIARKEWSNIFGARFPDTFLLGTEYRRAA
jgi:hypothetical protein